MPFPCFRRLTLVPCFLTTTPFLLLIFFCLLKKRERERKKSSFSTSKAWFLPSTFLLSSWYSALGWGLRDEGLSDWVSAHQPERQAFLLPSTVLDDLFSPFILLENVGRAYKSLSGLMILVLAWFFFFFFPNVSPRTSKVLVSSAQFFCVPCCTSIYQCQSPVLKLNRLAHIDYRWIKNKAWCKF